MKIKYLLLLLNLAFAVNSYAQTGVNTTTNVPAQVLQVSGSSTSTQIGTSGVYVVQPTIKIDGLNNTNNPLASGSTSLFQPVSATQNGELILSNDYAVPLIATDLGTDEIPTPVTVDATSGTIISGVIKTYTFTLDQAAVVHFVGALSVTVSDLSGNRLTDKINRIYRCYFNITAAPAGVPLNAPFARVGYSYTNGSSTGMMGNQFLQPDDYQILPKGSYTVQLVGAVIGSSPGAGATVRGVFGNSPFDRVNITAIIL